ncbi:MAG: formate--tetrahydrofolate ligase, partial [Chloroflexi bacterium]|nr:formate--tetrahydrofolate ligase [Chloroflexota bacterium]
ALRLGEYCVTESGFGSELGFEKFVNIKCRASGLQPNAAVVVATIRALKSHSGKFKIVAGKPLDPALREKDIDAVEAGMGNLAKHIENVRGAGIPAVVALNMFPTDHPDEVDHVLRRAVEAGAYAACRANHWAEGGAGAAELAEAVVSAADSESSFTFLYPLEHSVKQKIQTIATAMYGAAGVEYMPAAERAIKRFTELGYNDLPICMAKTPLSLSHDAALKGRPSGFTVTIRDVRLSAGAGFLYPLLGEIRTMPGLPSQPAGERMGFGAHGEVVGLF